MKGEIRMPRTEAQKLARANYDAKAYDQILVRVKKGKREEWKQAAAERNIAYAELIRRGADEYIANHPVIDKGDD